LEELMPKPKPIRPPKPHERARVRKPDGTNSLPSDFTVKQDGITGDPCPAPGDRVPVPR
jgi:hypothetical protein